MKRLGVVVLAALLLGGCGDSQPTDAEVQVALSNCALVTPADGDRSSVLVCSDEFMAIGARAFVEKYRTR